MSAIAKNPNLDPALYAGPLTVKERIAMHRAIIDSDPPICGWCDKPIGKPRRYTRQIKYCDDDHAARAARRRRNERDRERDAILGGIFELEEGEERRGKTYEAIMSQLTDSQLEDWMDGRLSNVDVSRMILPGASPQAVGYARKAAVNDRILELASTHWEPEGHYAEMLGPSDEEMNQLYKDDPTEFELRIITMVAAFVEWRTHFFRVGFETTYITKTVHRRWIAATLKTIYKGGRTLILSPPRHGKTDLLIHFCVWLIIRNPNIRILWVGPNGDIAENCLSQVRDLLETHEALKAAYLSPTQSWAPTRRGGALWARQRFTVSNRTLTLKQPTMWSTGVGGKILSLDCDFIIVDDPADPDASQLPSGREKIEKWFKIKLMTRKMHHTGLTMISSRVHPEDLYSEFVDSNRWEVVVDRAHDMAVCQHTLWDNHEELDQPDACVLFPEINPLEYLREQADVVGEALFEMMYLNQPRPEGTLIFDPDLIRQRCLNYNRGLGIKEIKGTYRLVAGLDPASRGVQAAFLWAVQFPSDHGGPNRDPKLAHLHQRKARFYLVDLETQKAGGPEGAHRVMRDWYDRYQNEIWVVESNAYMDVFFDDPRTKLLAAELGLTVRPTETGPNKHDPDFGVAGMAPLFHEGQVDMPYGTPDARRMVELYIRQMVNFTADTVSTRTRAQRRAGTSDLLMASWFPHATVIKKWRREERRSEVTITERRSFSGFDEDMLGGSPWPETAYPA